MVFGSYEDIDRASDCESLLDRLFDALGVSNVQLDCVSDNAANFIFDRRSHRLAACEID